LNTNDPALLREDEVDSTNDAVAALAAQGAPSGTALAAERQRTGRGRRGRSWVSLPGRHIFLSVLHRPALEPARLSGLTLDIGVAVAEVLEGHGLAPRLKWPNDIQLGGRKVGGILCEVVDGPAVIIGLGLNVEAAALPAELGTATTLAAEGVALEREALLAELVGALRAAAAAYDERGAPRAEAFLSRAVGLGARVKNPLDGKSGTLHGLDADGALLVHWEGAAQPERFIAGDLDIL